MTTPCRNGRTTKACRWKPADRGGNTVPAYLIVEVETTDEALMAEYRRHTPGLVVKFGGTFSVRGGKTGSGEGDWKPSSVVVMEFPHYAAAERFYDSPDYKPVLDMRLRAGKSKAIIVDGHNG